MTTVTPQGSEILVSTSNAGNQSEPQITSLANGAFVVTWQSRDGGTGLDIRGRVFTTDGTPVTGGDFLVSTTNAENQLQPQITSLANGGFVVTWLSSDNGSDYDVRGRVFAADGTPVSSDFLVSTLNTEFMLPPQITALADGGFAVTWVVNTDIRGRVFAADGTPVNGSDFLVSTSNTNNSLRKSRP